MEINCAVYYSWTHAAQHEAYYKHSLKTEKLDLFCFGVDPSHLAVLGYSLPFRKKEKKKPSWLISSILADGGKQKYRNDCTHCPPFEKRYPGKSSREQKNKKIQDAAIITLGYPVLSHGIYQWPPCLGFDPQLLQKSQENKGQEMSLPLWTAETKSNLAQLTTWTMTTRLAV